MYKGVKIQYPKYIYLHNLKQEGTDIIALIYVFSTSCLVMQLSKRIFLFGPSWIANEYECEASGGAAREGSCRVAADQSMLLGKGDWEKRALGLTEKQGDSLWNRKPNK